MLRAWSTKRVPWSKPAEYIVTRPIAASSSDGEGEQAVEAGPHRPRPLPERGRVEDGAHRRSQGLAAAGASLRSATRAPATPSTVLPFSGTASIGARRADRRRRLALARRRDVGLARILAGEHEVEHPAGDRRRRAGAEAGVLDHQGERDRRVLERRERGVERVVAVQLVDLGGVVLLVRLDRDHLRRAGLAAGLVRRAGEHPGRRALLGDAVERVVDHRDMLRLPGQRRRLP